MWQKAILYTALGFGLGLLVGGDLLTRLETLLVLYIFSAP